MKTLFIILALAACEHEEDAELEESLDACEEELCDGGIEGEALCEFLRHDRNMLAQKSFTKGEGKIRRAPIESVLLWKRHLRFLYCREEQTIQERYKNLTDIVPVFTDHEPLPPAIDPGEKKDKDKDSEKTGDGTVTDGQQPTQPT